MQSLNPHNAKTYDYMRRSDEVADRVVKKSRQLLAKTWDKKHTRHLGRAHSSGYGYGQGQGGGGAPVQRICSPPRNKRTLVAATRTVSPERGQPVPFLHHEGEDASLLNPGLYT